jgi:hypothetical protein
MCAGGSHRTSVTAGTIFDRTRTPLTVWFTACWLFATAKDGISALSLQRRAWHGYDGITGLGYEHDRRSQRTARAAGEDSAGPQPGVHRVASLTKRWLLGTHQGRFDEAHLQNYLDEFVFRFNRRKSRSRGLLFYRVLELAVGHDPVRYSNITAGTKPRKVLPTPPRTRRHPPSLDRSPLDLP